MLVHKPLHVKEKPGGGFATRSSTPPRHAHVSASDDQQWKDAWKKHPVRASEPLPREGVGRFIKDLLLQCLSREAMTELCSPGAGFRNPSKLSGCCMTDEPGAIGIGTVHYECYYDRRPPGTKSLYVRDWLSASVGSQLPWKDVLELDEITSYFWSFRQSTKHQVEAVLFSQHRTFRSVNAG